MKVMIGSKRRTSLTQRDSHIFEDVKYQTSHRIRKLPSWLRHRDAVVCGHILWILSDRERPSWHCVTDTSAFDNVMVCVTQCQVGSVDEWFKYDDFSVFLIFFIIWVIGMTSFINLLPVPELWKAIPRKAGLHSLSVSRDSPPFPYFQLFRQSPILNSSCTCIRLDNENNLSNYNTRFIMDPPTATYSQTIHSLFKRFFYLLKMLQSASWSPYRLVTLPTFVYDSMLVINIFNFLSWVRQGCGLSPVLFNIYINKMLQEFKSDKEWHTTK